MRTKIAPSILSADFVALGQQVKTLEVGGADYIHIDVMDGCFVPSISFGLPIVRAVRRITTLPLDVHLMVTHPEQQIAGFAAAGADMITIHAETTAHLHAALASIRAAGCRAGLALNPHTPASVAELLWGALDLLLILMVNPGWAGQKLLPEMLPKIEAARRLADAAGRTDLEISVDGGITLETAPWVRQRGASVLVAGTVIFGAEDGISNSVRRLRAAADLSDTTYYPRTH